MKQITRISPYTLLDKDEGTYGYNEEIIVGADATRFRNGANNNSCIMGLGTQSTADNQVVIGKYNNKDNKNALFIIGNGNDEANKSNIVEVNSSVFLIKKDLNVEGNSILNTLTVNNKLTINGYTDIIGTLNTNKLTVTTDAQVSGNLNVTGTIKGTMQNSSGTSYVIATTLDDYYKKEETYTQTEILGLKTLTNYYTKDTLDTALANKMNVTPASIELYGNTPFIDFHFQSSTDDYTSRIIEKGPGTLQINGVICDYSTGFTKSDGATGVLSSWYACIEEMELDHLTTNTHSDNIVTSCGFYPSLNNTYNLGKADKRWAHIYLKSNPNVSSDRNLKKEIKSLNIEKYKSMYLSLKPCSYLFKDDKENQTHFGFIAQEVEESCNLLNEDKQYALYSKDKETGEYGMSYSEMIALNTCMIQHILLENENLKKEIQKLKGNS